MKDLSNKQSTAPQLNKVRTFLFGALAFMWFAEMVQWGFLASTGGWQNVWKDIAPQLATALLITHAIRAAAKGALGVMAVFGLRSKNPITRTALFISMSLVPPCLWCRRSIFSSPVARMVSLWEQPQWLRSSASSFGHRSSYSRNLFNKQETLFKFHRRGGRSSSIHGSQ